MGACFEVYKVVGNGFTEPVYQACLEKEFELREVPFTSQPKIEFSYKGLSTGKHFVPDFVVFDRIILEIKAIDSLNSSNLSQVINYLNATGLKLGILANFGSIRKLEHKRIANTEKPIRSRA